MGIGRGIFFKLLVILAVVVYVLIGSYKVEPGTAYLKAWSVDVETAEVESSSSENVSAEQWIPYRVEDYFGYVQGEGTLLLRSPIMWNVAFSDNSYCNYSRSGDNLVVRDPIKDYLYPLNLKGYPIERNGRYYILNSDSTGVSAVSSKGEHVFSKEFSSVISSIDSNESFVGIGLLSGGVELFTLDGSYYGKVKPETSRIDVVYGTALSAQTDNIALVHGIDPQFLSIYQMKGSAFQLIHQIEISQPKRSHTILNFSSDGRFLLCETGSDLMVVSIEESFERFSIPIRGKLIDFEFVSDLESIYVMVEEEEDTLLYIYSEAGRLYSEERFSGYPQWLRYVDKALYLGVGSRLEKISVKGPGI